MANLVSLSLAIGPPLCYTQALLALVFFGMWDSLWPSMKMPVHVYLAQQKILNAVVSFIAIDVVNMLLGLKNAAKMSLHHVTMFSHIAVMRLGMVGNAQQDIATGGKLTACTKESVSFELMSVKIFSAWPLYVQQRLPASTGTLPLWTVHALIVVIQVMRITISAVFGLWKFPATTTGTYRRGEMTS